MNNHDVTAPAEAVDIQFEAWLASLPATLRVPARKHGRRLFEFTLNTCQINEELGGMQQLIRSADAQARLNRLAQTLNNLAEIGRTGNGWTVEDMLGCKADIDTAIQQTVIPVASAIMLPPGAKRH